MGKTQPTAKMVEKVKAKNTMECDVKVLTRKKNTPNEAVYEELKSAFAASFEGVVMAVLGEE